MKSVVLPDVLVCCAVLVAGVPDVRAADDLPIAGFEGADYGQWKTTGNAFGQGPAKGKVADQGNVTGFQGKGLANSYPGRNGYAATGTLTSPPVKVERKYISFLIAGSTAGTTALQLLIDGMVVASGSGLNDEQLRPGMFDVTAYQGRTVQLRIVDNSQVWRGHVLVDQIVQTDEKPVVLNMAGREKEFKVDSKYLVMPINHCNSPFRIQVYIDGGEVRNYDIPLAFSAKDTECYVYFTIEEFKGRRARVVMDKATAEAFALIRGSDTIPGEENFYKEPHRPQFHFTQNVGWNNDPNGMVYHNGIWHFFFQRNPVGLGWGNMTWGHATSKDLLHWEQQPDKFFPKTMAKGDCFSGSATVDKKNTSGWGKDALVAFFTDTGSGESAAYSTDNGKTFTFYKNNPVLKHQGRDPKVIWYTYQKNDTPLNDRAKELGGHWVMAALDELGGKFAAFYTSVDMKNWTEQSRLSGYDECMELFALPVDGDNKNTRWVLFAGDARYTIGSFDGKTFTPEHPGKRQVHWGCYYASQTFDNAPNGRKIQMGWVRRGFGRPPWDQLFSFPHQLTLHKTEDSIRMFAKPVDEIEKLRAKSNKADAQDLVADRPVNLPVGSDLLDVRLTVDVGNAKEIVLNLPGRQIVYSVTEQRFKGIPPDDRTGEPEIGQMKPVNGKIDIQVLADRGLTEIIGNHGRVFITTSGPPKQNAPNISLVVRGGGAKLITLEAHELKSIWDK